MSFVPLLVPVQVSAYKCRCSVFASLAENQCGCAQALLFWENVLSGF